MTQRSLPWENNAVGDGHAYTDAEWRAVWKQVFARAIQNAGVLKGCRSEYAASGAATPIVVQPGTAVVDGLFCDSDANENIVVPTPVGATRIDRIVIRHSAAAEEGRLYLLQGAEGGGAPTLVHTAGVTWDIPLWQISTTTGGVITFVADERVYAVFGNESDIPCAPGGRLTLSGGVPVPSSDVTAAGTIYYTPWKSNRIPVFVNSALRNFTFVETSLSIAALLADTNYDVFAYVNSAGVLALETVAWSNSGAGTGARATALTTYGGLVIKSGDTSRTYLGTIRITGSVGQCEDSEARRYVWNYYNQVPRSLKAQMSTASWAYSTDTWRASNANTTDGQGRVGIVIGLQEGALVEAWHIQQVRITGNTGNSRGAVGIGLNSTTVNSSIIHQQAETQTSGDNPVEHTHAQYRGSPVIGYNQLQRLEKGAVSVAGTVTFEESGTLVRSGLDGVIRA